MKEGKPISEMTKEELVLAYWKVFAENERLHKKNKARRKALKQGNKAMLLMHHKVKVMQSRIDSLTIAKDTWKATYEHAKMQLERLVAKKDQHDGIFYRFTKRMYGTRGF